MRRRPRARLQRPVSDTRRAWWTVARWELRRTLRRADFVVSVLLTPALIFGVSAGAQWMEQRSQSRMRTIAIARGGDSPGLDSLQGVHWLEVVGAEASRDALLRAVRERRYDGALLVPADFAAGGKPELIVRREMPSLQRRIESFLKNGAREHRAAARGLDSTGLAFLDADVGLVVAVADARARSSGTDRAVAMALMVLVMTVTFITGSYTMIGISAEKQARVTEIIVSAIPAQAWMDGKIFAYSVLGLITGFIWALSGIWILLTFGQTIPSSLSLTTAMISILYSVLGFALYVAFFAAVMATLKDFNSATKLQGNFLIMPLLPLFFLGPVLDSPESGFAIGISLIPFFSPMLMPMRIALGQASTWQVVLGLVLLVGGVWLMRRIAGTVFRIGMLMYGKDINLPELIRLARRG
jgi:ABC-2 type transport system permease protein